MVQQRQRTSGFTLIETLIVIGIVGLLLAIALPAIQRVREEVNRTTCGNSLRQLGLAMMLHHDDHGLLPSNGGWDGAQTILDAAGDEFTPSTTDYAQGVTWHWGVGRPDRAPREQGGSWLYALLPYLEDAAAHRGVRQDHARPLFHCPTRRPARNGSAVDDHYGAYRTGNLAWAKTDYAANGYVVPNRPYCSALADIHDGLSNTILLGEKALYIHDLDRETWYWDEPFFLGGSGGTQRSRPLIVPDALARYPYFVNAWGSAHGKVALFLFADGSVRRLPAWLNRRVTLQLLTPSGGEASPSDNEP